MDRRNLLFWLVLPTLLIGCRSSAPPSYVNWADTRIPQGESDGFSAYAHAAELAEAPDAGKKYLERVYFTQGMKTSIADLLKPALAEVRKGSASKVTLNLEPESPFEQKKYVRGWRLLGRALAWRVENNILIENYDAAVSDTILATKFGFDLSTGGAMEASLGLSIVDDARKALAPALEKLTPEQLQSLSSGLSTILQNRTPIFVTIENEEKNMLMAVQVVQDAYRDNKLDQLQEDLGPDIRNAIQYLKDMKPKDASERPKYFEGFANEARMEIKHLLQLAALPASERQEVDEPTLAVDRPWKRFSKHFFMSGPPLLEQYDLTLARTRLMALEASILSQVRSNGLPPADLTAVSQEIKTDPLTGKQFVYIADGGDFRVYSVGTDFRDDGGASDEAFLEPDLRLETGL